MIVKITFSRYVFDVKTRALTSGHCSAWPYDLLKSLESTKTWKDDIRPSKQNIAAAYGSISAD